MNKLKKIGYLLLSAVLAVFLYVLLHEFGHSIVMLSAGATVTEFSIVTAHVSGIGGNYSDLSRLWLHANGAIFPVVLSLVYMLIYDRKSENLLYHIFSYMLSLMPTGSLLAWVMIPFIYLQGSAPAGDDVTKFLDVFSQNHNPLIVSGAAVLLLAVSITLMIRKGIIKNFILQMRKDEGSENNAVTK